MSMATITAHCLVKNEENFVWYAVKSVINFVDKVIIFDTGSTDKTVEIVQGLVKEYPDKIIFEEKGECDKKRHTELRQEMVDRTTTDWFMILDGDEVWTRRGMEEALKVIDDNISVECLIAPFYLCVGDVYHYSWRGKFGIRGRKIHATPRFFKKLPGIHWNGEYGKDFIVDVEGVVVFKKDPVLFLENKFWHLTHLWRSASQGEYSSGGNRKTKLIPTYFIIGKKIKGEIPKIFDNKISENNRLSIWKSLCNFFRYIYVRYRRNN
jgi:glycosyltransferase involved in cell wall biosynthesis